MAEDTDIDQPVVSEDEQQAPSAPNQGPGPKPTLKDADKQKLVQIITKMQAANESEDNIRATVRRFQEIALAPSASPINKGIKQTDQTLNQPIQFNGTFQPDLEGEKNGLHLNDPDYQKQKQEFVSRVATDDKGNLLYPEQDEKGQWKNTWTNAPLPNFDPNQMQGKILQVPPKNLKATGGKQFITPVYDKDTNSYSFPSVQTPDVPHEQSLSPVTVYGPKIGTAGKEPAMSPDVESIASESDKQGGKFRQVLKNHPELSTDIDNTLKKYGPEYQRSLGTGSEAMSNVLQKTVEDKYDLNRPLPNNVDPDILNGHLNVLNNFEKNKQQFQGQQQELQRQADLITDRAKRTGQPVEQQDIDNLAKKASDNLQKWNEYSKSVNYSQNFVNQPNVKNYLNEFKKRQTGIQLSDEINQRSFPNDIAAQTKQGDYDRKAIEGNLNAWDYAKNIMGRAGSGLSNIGETALKVGAGMMTGGVSEMIPGVDQNIEKLNANAQKFISTNLPAISPEAIEQMNKLGIGHTISDVTGVMGGFAPYIIPGLAEEGLGVKAATFGTALAENLPTARKEAEKQGLTGSAYNTYVAAKPLVNAAFMTLLPNVKFAKGFENDLAESIVNGEFSNPKRALLNLASKIVKDPGDVAHLQAMLSGTELGNALVNKVTNGLQGQQDIDRGISRKDGLSTDLSNVFNPRQTVVMALAGKALEAIPTLKNAIGDVKTGKDVQETYDNIQNNLVELAGHNLEGVSEKVNEMVRKDPGNIYAQHLKNTIEDFAHAEARMPEGLEPEQKAALFDVQKQILQKQRQMAYADPVYQPHIQKNIDELNKQIPEILKDPKQGNKYLEDAHKDLSESILSPKTEDNEKTEAGNAPEAEGQINEKPKEGAESTTSAGAAPSIEPVSWARTLDYGDNKGKEENKQSQDEIKDQILKDEPIGGSGEKFSQLLGRVIPGIQKVMAEDPHNTTVVSHSSVIKALNVWEDMGRPDISELTGDKLKEFAQKYVDMKPEAEGKVHTFKAENGNDVKIVRHGETEDNKLSEFREDDTKLTDKGIAQAGKAGENLIKETGGDIPKIYSSDLPRTMHTSDIINQKLQDHAVQERSPEKVLQREQEEVASAGSGRERVESGQQGGEPAGKSEPTKEESKTESKEKVDDDSPFVHEEGDDEFTSTKNAVTQQKIEDYGLEPAAKEAKREFGTVWDQAQKKINKGFDIEKLVKDLGKKPRAVTDLENAMVLYHQNVKESQLAEASKDLDQARKDNNRPDWTEAYDRRAKLLDELQNIYNVDKAIGRETARGLNARKMMADRRFSLVNMQLEKRASNGGEPLTEKQESDLKNQHEEIKKTKEAYEARIEELQKENARLSAEKALSEQKKATGKTRKSKEDFNKERKDIVQQMRADLLRVAKGGEGLTSSIPLAAQLKAVAPHVGKLVKSFIEQGVDKLEDISKHVYDLLKPEMPDLEERHVHDLIAGEFNEPKVVDPKTITPAQKNRKEKAEAYKNVKAESGVQKYRATDPKLMKLQADYERAKDKYQQGLTVDERKSRTILQKTQDAFLKYERFAKLSNPITLGKLAAAALTRLATTPIEEGVGGVYSALLPGLAKKAPGEAGIHVNALAKGYREAFMRGLDDAATVAKGGKTDIEAIFGKKGHVPPEALDFFGQLHSALKAPVKRFAFARSFQKRIANNIKNGVTIDGMTEARIALESYKDAERSIFMQDNPVSRGWNAAMAVMEKSGDTGKLAATIGQWLIPFVKVPTNILAETVSHVAGPEIALGKVMASALGKGLKNMSQEEAESIMRNLKKGTIGHVALMAGYLNPQAFGGYYHKDDKRKPGDIKPGDMKLMGHTVPAWALEAPLFQAMQIGATVRRVKETMVKGEEKGIGEGVWGGALGLMSHEPLIDEPSRLSGMMASAKDRQYFLGELAKSTLVPAISEYAAKVTDPVDTRSTGQKLIEPENDRKPETVKEHIESAIPGLRENVPVKKPPVKTHRQRQHR